jgi:hypothetical protein
MSVGRLTPSITTIGASRFFESLTIILASKSSPKFSLRRVRFLHTNPRDWYIYSI